MFLPIFLLLLLFLVLLLFCCCCWCWCRSWCYLVSIIGSLDYHPPSSQTMLKTFLPIILFSIALPLIDIVTDLRLIIRLYETQKYFATLLLGV